MTDAREELAKAMIRGLEQMIATATTNNEELTEWQRSEVQEIIHESMHNDVPDYVQDMVYEKAVEVLDDILDDRISDWVENNLADRLTINFE
jgi:hypothetical protein